MNSRERLVYRFGEFEIDTEQRQLRRADLTIPLAPRVYDTLLVLVERAGCSIDRHTLVLQVWPDGYVDDELLSRNIATLRQILGEMPDGRPYIEAHPRRGYRFVPEVEQMGDVPIGANAVAERSASRSVGAIRRLILVAKSMMTGPLALTFGYWLSAVSVEIP